MSAPRSESAATAAARPPRLRPECAPLEALWRAEAVGALLAERLPAFRDGALRLSHVKRGALRVSGDRLDATYELAVFDPSQETDVARPEERCALMRVPLTQGDAKLGVALLFLSPEDPLLDACAALRPPVLRALARRAGLPEEAAAGARVTLLAHRFGSRVVWRCAFPDDGAGGAPRGPGGARALALKIRRREPAGRLVLAPDARPAPAAIPLAFPVPPIEGAFLDASEWIAAPSLHETIARGAAGRGAARPRLHEVGAAVAGFHRAARLDPTAHDRLSPERLPVRHFDGEVAQLATLARTADRFFDGAAAAVRGPLSRLADDALAARGPRGLPRRVLVHGDLHDKQILLGGGRAVFIDHDAIASGDPELDLGNLSAHFILRALQRGESTDAARGDGERLVEGYSATRAGLDGALLSLYRRASLLRLALLYLFRVGSAHLFSALLDEERCAS